MRTSLRKFSITDLCRPPPGSGCNCCQLGTSTMPAKMPGLARIAVRLLSGCAPGGPPTNLYAPIEMRPWIGGLMLGGVCACADAAKASAMNAATQAGNLLVIGIPLSENGTQRGGQYLRSRP